MKKLAICLFIAMTGIFSMVFSKENTINEVKLNSQMGAPVLNISSEYKEKLNFEDNYIDIKNAKLSDGFKADYADKTSSISIVAQQIGSNVRIYLKGVDINNIKTQIEANKGNSPIDWPKSTLLALFLTFVALKSCSATMKLASDIENIKYPVNEAKTLNRGMFKINKSPEIVLNSMTNTIKEDVYIDFQYAKDKKNIKIAI